MERKQELEWAEAQKIVISKDLVAAAKQQLQFLAAVDRNRHLYETPALYHAIYRYKYCWLPLLAKHAESEVSGPLVVPLDCEWIWHCHRLNPVRYVIDCKNLYGRILDNRNVVSSVHGACKKKTEEVWNKLYPGEPYELDMNSCFSDDKAKNIYATSESTMYDLVSAVRRQIPFFYQVSRAFVNDTLFLKGAVARYKGFLHMIKRNRERSIKSFCVPTYDIDLIWHSHQLHPASYCKDLRAIMGKVLQHDDTDSNRTKGQKLDVGFSETTKQWEETFGSRYWRAGAMHRGSAPSPLTINLRQLETVTKKVVMSDRYQNVIQLPKRMVVEVMMEIVAVRDSLAGHNGSLFVSFSKKQPDMFFNTRRRIDMSSESEEKEVSVFQCEPTGELVFELMSNSPSVLPMSKAPMLLGTSAITLKDLLNPASTLQVEKWFDFMPNSGVVSSKPISLRIALSLTTPIPSSYVLRMVRSGGDENAKSWTWLVDEADNELLSIQMRVPKVAETTSNHLLKKKVIGMTPSGATHVLAEFVGTGWSLMNSDWFFHLPNKFDEEDPIFELIGNRKVIILPGRKLEYETKNCSKKTIEQNFMTAIEFSTEHPYGKAVALLNLKSGFLEIKDEWLLLPGITLAFILSNVLKEGYGGFTMDGEKHNKLVENDLKDSIVEYSSRCGVCFKVDASIDMAKYSKGGGACNGGSSDNDMAKYSKGGGACNGGSSVDEMAKYIKGGGACNGGSSDNDMAKYSRGGGACNGGSSVDEMAKYIKGGGACNGGSSVDEMAKYIKGGGACNGGSSDDKMEKYSNGGGACNGGSSIDKMEKYSNGGGVCNGGSSMDKMEKYNKGGGACNGGSSDDKMAKYNKGGGACNGGSSDDDMAKYSKGGGACNGSSSDEDMAKYSKGGGACNGGSSDEDMAIYSKSGGACNGGSSVEDMAKSSRCGGCSSCSGCGGGGGHCGGGGCRGSGCGYESAKVSI